jgi:hypothetical protein
MRGKRCPSSSRLKRAPAIGALLRVSTDRIKDPLASGDGMTTYTLQFSRPANFSFEWNIGNGSFRFYYQATS